MHKDNIFLATTMAKNLAQRGGSPVQRIVCAANAAAAASYVKKHFDTETLLGLCSWMDLETTALKLRSGLACEPGALPVFMDASVHTH